MRANSIIWIAVLSGLLWLTFPRRALAYLDPGTGSYLFQVLIAVGLGALFMVKTYWARIKAFFAKKHSEQDE